MKEFVEKIRSIYNKISSFQMEMEEKKTSHCMGHILSKDDLTLHAIHLSIRWAEIEAALNSIANIKVDPKYESVPFGVESNDGLLDYIQAHYPMIYNEACNNAFKIYDCENVLEFEKSE